MLFDKKIILHVQRKIVLLSFYDQDNPVVKFNEGYRKFPFEKKNGTRKLPGKRSWRFGFRYRRYHVTPKRGSAEVTILFRAFVDYRRHCRKNLKHVLDMVTIMGSKGWYR